jgi:heterodisulfide reductase subunit A
VGNFRATIRKKARYVDVEVCNSCGECAKVCPTVHPDEYQMGLSTRHAIYIPFPQAVPCSYILDMEHCLGNNPIACGKCADVCEQKAIDFDDQDELITREIGAVIVAIGADVYDPTELDEYGYSRFKNVITSMEFERLICAGGPSAGHFVRPSDHERPRRIGFVQCVGSRNPAIGRPWCSNICCMNTVKDTLLLADHYPDTENVVFYQDIRAFGKSFEDMFQRSKEAGVRYVRGLPGEVVEEDGTGNVVVTVENTTTGRLERHELDMLVLSVGVEPPKDLKKISGLLTLSKTSDGFFMESHPKLKPIDAPTKGVFFAGFCESPKDIKDSVCQAGAAASRAGALLSAGDIHVEAITSHIDETLCMKCGICAGICPYGAIEWEKGGVARVIEAACAGCGSCSASRSWPRSGRCWLRIRRIRSSPSPATGAPTPAGTWPGSPGSPTRRPTGWCARCARPESPRRWYWRPSAAALRLCWSRAVTTRTVTTSAPTGRP